MTQQQNADAGAQLRRLRTERGVSLAAMARMTHYSKGYLSKIENGEKPLTPGVARQCDQALRTGGTLVGLLAQGSVQPATEPAAAGSYHRAGERGGFELPAEGTPETAACVGRDPELASLSAAATAALTNGLRVLWVTGEAGGGKTTFARAGARILAKWGWQVAWGRCPEVDGAPPAWAWAQVAGTLLGLTASAADGAGTAAAASDGGPLAALTRHHAQGPDAVPEALFWAARAVGDLVARSIERCPQLVVLDDLHRDRGEVLQLLRYLHAELIGRPVLVLAIYRATEITAELRATQGALAGSRSDLVELPGLSPADVATVLERTSGSEVGGDVAESIAVRTGGNPLFVSELGRLIRADGIEAATRTVPAGVRQVLRARLAGLTPGTRTVLSSVAILGLDADVGVLAELGPTAVPAVIDAVEAALRSGLVYEPGPGQVRFTHAMVRDVLYEEISLARRVHLHGRAAEVLHRAGADTATLAHHALAAATPSTARAAAILAGRAARVAASLAAYQEASALLARALSVLELTSGAPGTTNQALHLDLLRSLVSAQAHAGNVIAARVTRLRAVEAARAAADPREIARAYAAFDAPALWTAHAYQQVDAALVAGLERALAGPAGQDDRLRCHLLTTLAFEVDASDPDRTQLASSQATAIARRLDDPMVLCRALNACYIATTLDPDGGADLEAVGREQLATATAAGLTGYQAQGHQILFMAALDRHELERAQWHVDRAVEHATSGQLELALGILAMYEALRALIAGRFDEADHAYARISAALRAVGDPNSHTFDLLVRFCVEHARGGSGSAARMSTLADEARPVYDQLGQAIAEPYTRLLIGAGRLAEARACWTPQIPVRRDYYWLLWMVFRAENAVLLGVRNVAAACYDSLTGYAGHLPELVHGHVAVGPVDHTLGQLAAFCGWPSSAVNHFQRAVAVATRLGAPHWAARSRHALVRLTAGATAL